MSVPLLEPLSARQAEIARFVARGKSSRAIADTLHLSPRTVENHIAAIYEKLGVRSRAELIGALVNAGRDVGETNELALGRPAGKTNVPHARTPLLARESDIAQIINLLDDNRVVTLTGAGGVGKTRIAQAVGAALLEATPGGVWFVELAPIANEAFVASAIAKALDVREAARPSLLDALLIHLRNLHVVLVLDNCEHVVAGTASVVDALLRECGRLRILATSREPLRVAGEQTYRVPSLAVPKPPQAAPVSAADAADYSAVALFVARARAIDRRFALTDNIAPSIVEICRRLDGIPLAIELAAARVNILTVQALAEKLDNRFAILTGGIRTGVPRHQTMRALIDWSFDLLAPNEQQLLEGLSVFAGGCDLAAATAVIGEGAAESDLLESLASLVDKSLLVAETTAREPRYRLLESTRQYAREKLAARGGYPTVAGGHAHTYLELAEQFESADTSILERHRQKAELEIENWRAALDWALEQRGDIVLGQRLVIATRTIWTFISHAEGRRWIALAIDRMNDQTPPLIAARLDVASVMLAQSSGDWGTVIARSEPLIQRCRELNTPLDAALLEYAAGKAYLCVGRWAEGEPFLRSVLDYARCVGHPRLAGRALYNLAYARSSAGNLIEARALFDEGSEVWRSIGEEAAILGGLVVLAEAEFRAGNAERACEIAAAMVGRMRERATLHIDHMTALINLAAYSIACDRWEEARSAGRDALAVTDEATRKVFRLWALQHMGAVAALAPRAAGDQSGIICAAQLFGYVDARLRRLGAMREFTEEQEYDRVQAVFAATLGAARSQRLAADGAAMSEAKATELALSVSLREKR